MAGAVVVSLLVVGVSGEATASACERTWVANGDADTNWDQFDNWAPQGIPGPGEVICISTSEHVIIDQVGQTTFHVDEVQLGASTQLEIKDGAALLIDGGAESVWAAGTNVAVNNNGNLGGLGTIRVQGAVRFASPAEGSKLTSGASGGGRMVVEGLATVAANGLGIEGGYRVDVASGGRLRLDPGTWVAADPGTATTIGAGATLELTGDGGYYQGAAGQPGTLVNNGVITKTGGLGTSVIDAAYQGAGQLMVQSGGVAMPDGQLVGGAVWPDYVLATGRCGTIPPTGVCSPTQDPAKDAMSVAFKVPATNGASAAVQLRELGSAVAVDPLAIGNEVLAHADQMVADRGHPATIGLRFSQADVMATPLDQVQVVHTTDAGFQVELPTCFGAALPLGIDSCVVRPVTRDAQNTYITVLTTETSRWHARRDLPHENTGAPTMPQTVTVTEASPFDGSAFKVAWAAPASEGAGPVSGYRVHLDGDLVQSPAGTSVVVRNPGPGTHEIAVSAVNAAGTSGRAIVGIAVKTISKPRKVTARPGRSGDPRTAKVTWKPPAEAGGFAIKGYLVAVYRDGRKIDTHKVKAGARSLQVKLPRGTYTFRVRARNTDKKGPWSKPTDAVRPR